MMEYVVKKCEFLRIYVFWNYKSHKAFDSKGLKKKQHIENGAKTLLTFSAEKTRLVEDLNTTIFDY